MSDVQLFNIDLFLKFKKNKYTDNDSRVLKQKKTVNHYESLSCWIRNLKYQLCCRIQNKPEKSTKTANKKDDEEPIVNPLLQATEEEARVDEGEEEPGKGEGEEEAMPVPQVKIGPDGSLIINEERSAMLKFWFCLLLNSHPI